MKFCLVVKIVGENLVQESHEWLVSVEPTTLETCPLIVIIQFLNKNIVLGQKLKNIYRCQSLG